METDFANVSFIFIEDIAKESGVTIIFLLAQHPKLMIFQIMFIKTFDGNTLFFYTSCIDGHTTSQRFVFCRDQRCLGIRQLASRGTNLVTAAAFDLSFVTSSSFNVITLKMETATCEVITQDTGDIEIFYLLNLSCIKAKVIIS